LISLAGTGKSFIGALIAKALYRFTSKTILVVCYTNHALDDILEGLLDVGIPPDTMLRLGGKSTARTEPLLLQKQFNGHGARTRDQWTTIDMYRRRAEILYKRLENAFNRYLSEASQREVFSYLKSEEPAFYDAFEVPDREDSDGMVRVGKGGEEVSATYLLSHWRKGWKAGIFERDIRNSNSTAIINIWDMKYHTRLGHFQRWKDTIKQKSIEKFVAVARDYNECLEHLMQAQNDSLPSILRSKRIVGCTTTAAAKYGDAIRTFNPDVLLVEEAGEILESHILTALGPKTSQMILIGDHK
jgi:AAA domain